jgi:hypothetical protein
MAGQLRMKIHLTISDDGGEIGSTFQTRTFPIPEPGQPWYGSISPERIAVELALRACSSIEAQFAKASHAE